jgi:hypothetical protein
VADAVAFEKAYYFFDGQAFDLGQEPVHEGDRSQGQGNEAHHDAAESDRALPEREYFDQREVG